MTKPEDRVPFPQKLAYGSGALVNNLLAIAMGNMMIVLNLGLGMNPAWVGLLGSIPRAFDAITDPLVGYISDNARTRWGRRRPFIFIGAIAAGVVFALLWQLPADQTQEFYFVWFLVGSLVFYLAYTIFVTPWVALGFELTPDYNERTNLMGVQFFIGQVPYLIGPWFLAIMTWEMWGSQRVGAGMLALMVGLVTVVFGIVPALGLQERPLPATTGDAGPKGLVANIVAFFKGFAITLRSVPFLRLCAATFLVFNGFQMIGAFQSYVLIYYVMGGDEAAGAQWLGWAGTVQITATFLVIPFVTWLSGRIGKKRTFYLSTGLSALGYALKWFCYSPTTPWLILLPMPLIAFALGGLFTLMPSMIADVVDLDELETHERREGMFGSIFWWVVKIGMSAALAGGGILLNATGFDVELGANQTENALLYMKLSDVLVPLGCNLLAIAAMAGYPLTEARANEVRDELEQRRGVAGDGEDAPAGA